MTGLGTAQNCISQPPACQRETDVPLPRILLAWGQQNCIDNVDDTVGGSDIRADDTGPFYREGAIGCAGKHQRVAVDGQGCTQVGEIGHHDSVYD
jgi:hypothetical protein